MSPILTAPPLSVCQRASLLAILLAGLSAFVPSVGLQALAAADRAALVVGIDAYPDAPLLNAVRDARAVQEMLRTKLGFPEDRVVLAENPDRLELFETFERFKGVAAEAEIVVVYYAGHGMESLDGRENFLLPRDAEVLRAAQSEAALRATGVNLMTLSADLAEATQGAKIVLMDCCRQRPAGRGVSRAGGGLVTYADARIPPDTLMILAAAPDRLASDGTEHGPFTEALLKVLPQSKGNLMDAFFAVSDRVRETTRDGQIPWLKFDGSGQIFRQQRFLAAVPGDSAMPPVPPPAPPALAARLRAATHVSPFVNGLGLEFVPVPGKEGVWMARTETRVRDFRAYASEMGYRQQGGAFVLSFEEGQPTWSLEETASWENPGFAQEEGHPVVCVSWEEARAFCDWISKQEEGLSYRLPTDAEWSAAVGNAGKYPWGDAWPAPEGVGNYSGREFFAELEDRGALGISLQRVEADGDFSLPNGTKSAALVVSTRDEGPGASAGIQAGDVILKLNGAEIDDHEHFAASIRTLRAGSDAVVEVYRAERRQELRVVLGSTASLRGAYPHHDGYQFTSPAGSFAENGFGFFDLGGNVWEWCEDIYKASMNDADGLKEFPHLKDEKHSDGTPFRVLRGASWSEAGEVTLRSSYRAREHPADRRSNRGFRMVVEIGVGG